MLGFKLVVFVGSLLCCSQLSARTLEQLEYYSEEFFPYNYVEDGQAAGFSVELLTLIFAQLNSPAPKVKIVPWARGYATLQQQAYTVLFSTIKTEPRKNKFEWACPINVSRGKFYGLSDSKLEISSLKDAENLKIAIMKGQAIDGFLTKSDFTAELVPVKSVEQAFKLLEQYPLVDWLPPALRPHGLDLNQALMQLHRPDPDTELSLLEEGRHPAQQRLVLEELAAHQLSMLKLRQEQQRQAAIALPLASDLEQQFLAQLRFKPTNAQQRVVAEIKSDTQLPHAMMRLVQGDVGSGKTLVAAMAALQALANGYQVALMAPTEILAEQHALNFAKWFEPLGIKVDWLAGKQKGKARNEAMERIASGEAQMVVGTHAIFQEQVQFAKLALVIIDEQHRFGVHQRMALREKGAAVDGCNTLPHQLIMTATPIPRTLAMTAYADLELSIIDELPPGRTPIKTVALPDTRREQVIERVYQACHNDGRQAYWVCTLIEESEVLQCQAAEDTADTLQKQLPDLRIGLVHGRMKPQEKQWVMEQFKSHQLDLLVATTVIEVGVDVPNASLMIIENPERLGLAQLHQLRGRVGRGSVASHCVLLYKTPLSDNGFKRLTFKTTKPLPTYLVAVAIAPYEEVRMNVDGIPVLLTALAADTSNLRKSFENLPTCIRTFVSSYGEHTFDRIGFNTVPFNSGAMEHATNIAYPRYAIANGDKTSETLFAHELAHHWWGNLVTCETAGDIRRFRGAPRRAVPPPPDSSDARARRRGRLRHRRGRPLRTPGTAVPGDGRLGEGGREPPGALDGSRGRGGGLQTRRVHSRRT